MQNLTVSVPHRLSRAEARRRVEDGIAQFRREAGAMLHNVQETWTGDRLQFSCSAVGQPIRGQLTVEDRVVQIEVELPWLFALLAAPVKHQLESHGRKLLESPDRH